MAMDTSSDRSFEDDLQALAARLRADDAFADELYCALCNADWRHDDGRTWHGSWRYSAQLVAALRDQGEEYYEFYWSPTRAEGSISGRVAAALAELGWRGAGHGSSVIYVSDPTTAGRKVWVNDDWIDVAKARHDHPELFKPRPRQGPNER